MEERETIGQVRDMLKGTDLDRVRSALDELLEEKPELAGELVSALPGLINVQVLVATRLARELDALPAQERAKRLREAIHAIDGASVGRAITEISFLLMKLHRENPDLAGELAPVTDAALAAADFGKLRAGVAALADFGTDAALGIVDPVVRDPVALANLFGMLVPLLNNLIRILARALSGVEHPKEFLASAIFNTLGEIDTKELGRAFTSTFKLINAIHEGNLVMGRDDPYLRGVFAQFAAGVLDHMDAREMIQATVALGEDAEVIFKVLIDLVLADPDLMARMLAGEALLGNTMFRTLSHLFHGLARLPDDALSKIGEEIRASLDADQIADTVNACLSVSNRLGELCPGLGDDLVEAAVGGLDREALGAAIQRAGERTLGALREDEGVRKALEPEEVGLRINRLLVRFNRSMESVDRSGSSYLTRAFAQVDKEELEKAMRNATGAVTDALLSSARGAMAVIRPVASACWRTIRFLAASLARRVLGQKETVEHSGGR